MTDIKEKCEKTFSPISLLLFIYIIMFGIDHFRDK